MSVNQIRLTQAQRNLVAHMQPKAFYFELELLNLGTRKETLAALVRKKVLEEIYSKERAIYAYCIHRNFNRTEHL